MKIALISNMNNNYFSLLRYLIDLGADVTLFKFEDEYTHFEPINDTWNIEKWDPYIKTLPFKYYDHYNRINEFNKDEILNSLSNYDILIGSGPSPAYLDHIGINLDAFFPYKTGIEYFKDDISWRDYKLSKKIRGFNNLQKKALRKTPYAINCDFRDETICRIKQLGMENLPLAMPMVYVEEMPEAIELPQVYLRGIKRMKSSDFVICHIGRHLWKRSWSHKIKGTQFINNNANDKIIKSFNNLLKKNDAKNVLLVLFEYGPQVALSKKLIKELQIEEHILWMPLSPRKIIMHLIPFCSIGIGDIAVGFWGGKALEFLASGVPLINSISKVNKMRYEKFTGHKIPPFIEIDNVGQLEVILNYYFINRDKLKTKSEASLEWFNEFDGVSTAKHILNFCEKRYQEKTHN